MFENKYRAWDKRYNKMCMVSQISFGKKYLFNENNVKEIDYGEVSSVTTPETGSVYGTDIILMLSANHTDKNNKEIFDGDIVKVKEFECPAVVKLDQKQAGFIVELLENSGFIFHIWDVDEVIGNIYENPEILKTHKNPMPESKKLSELISDLSRFHARAEYTDNMSEYHKTIETIRLIKNQIDQKFDNLEQLIDVTNIGKIQIEKFIDQKFEELRCECKKEKKLDFYKSVKEMGLLVVCTKCGFKKEFGTCNCAVYESHSKKN